MSEMDKLREEMLRQLPEEKDRICAALAYAEGMRGFDVRIGSHVWELILAAEKLKAAWKKK